MCISENSFNFAQVKTILFYMENLKNKFASNEWNMIEHILNVGKGEASWNDLAVTFQIKVGASSEQRRKASNDVWRKFNKLLQKNNLDLTVVKQTLNGNGEVLFETRKILPQEQNYDTTNMVIEKVTTNPSGGQWVTYKTKNQIEEDNSILNAVQRLIDKQSETLGFKTYEEKKDFFDKNRIVLNESCEIFFGQENNCNDESKKIAIVNLYDAHLDKLPIKSTCGVESTFEENIDIFKTTIRKIIAELVKIQNLQSIILPVGNDLFHTNGFNSQTKKGTQIEYYGSPEDSYYAICDVVTRVIKELAFIRPVQVLMVKGNHDEDKITTLGYWLERYFSAQNNSDNNYYHTVQVDFLRKQRKYIKFGDNLLGFAHGDKEKSKIAQLPLIMATEAKELWGQTTHRKMYLGDLHHGFEYQFLKAKDMPGVEVEYLRSVGTTDTWHEDFGWIGVPKTAYLQIFDEKEGELIRQKFNIK